MSEVVLASRPDPASIDPQLYLRESYAGGGERGLAMTAYYAVKPLVPRGLQLALRRRYATRQARREFPAWPIEPLLVEHQEAELRSRLAESGGERVPLVGFWPDRRRFAAILTHDVEGRAGIENIPAVLELERRHGLVSSWNFVAEWYPIPHGTFALVRDAGGEIGLHGIKHDGKLFRDRASFEGDLPKIHSYMEAWDAVGFRSPATHRNPDWMPELGCLYDSSFPDTDPFEPQSGGCCSIFPYLFGDLVELPITLVQDHTLMEILRERSIDLWRHKADWVIEHNGLINMSVHPDYVRSPERLGMYDEFLGYLRERIDRDAGWHALPREVAAWWRVRERLAVAGADGAPAIAGAAADDPLAARAAVAWAAERGERIAIDV
ncbi:MAG: hypothetical protein ACXVRH_03295 [Thermoleophilaceae bacterium]